MTDAEVNKDARILVVDDHPMTRNMVRAILRGVGFSQIFMAENGVGAQEVISEHPIDLVICDWNMPTMSGLEFLESVRENPLFKNTPFIMLTAEAYEENVRAAISAGVTDYVIKPFTAEILIGKVCGALSA